MLIGKTIRDMVIEAQINPLFGLFLKRLSYISLICENMSSSTIIYY